MDEGDFTASARRLSAATNTMNQAAVVVIGCWRLSSGKNSGVTRTARQKSAGMSLIKHLFFIGAKWQVRQQRPSHLEIFKPVFAAAKQVIVNLRTHFRKIPLCIGSRNELPADSFKEDESSDDASPAAVEETAEGNGYNDKDEEEKEEDTSSSFPPGKRALPEILWGTMRKFLNPARESALKLMTREMAHSLVNKDYGALIKSCSMETKRRFGILVRGDVYGAMALQLYLTEKYAYIYDANLCCEQQRICDRTPPPLPTDATTDRYALSNVISTNGLQLHTLCYDTTKAHRSRGSFAPVYRTERRFLTFQSILDEFGVEFVDDIDVWGVDLGKVNPAAFCRLERLVEESRSVGTSVDKAVLSRPEDSNNSPVFFPAIAAYYLVVSRLALYSPVLAHRSHLDNIKMQRPVVAPGQEVSADLWVSVDPDRDKINVSLPFIKDMENLLPPYQHDTQEELEKAIQRVFLVRPVLQDFYASGQIKRKIGN
ncbi:hypothetical protein BGZ47_002601 [Haplosporangium gracile]|nr:hypothetical protein BGZ47_002601 [Haplosporangium gracile]